MKSFLKNLQGAEMMDSVPFFSVIIPVYNSEKYLDDCIKSVFAQTCSDFELILVDDESKDSSPSICDEWQMNNPDRVRVIHQKNTGVYIAKRNGIRASHGRYLYIMDNDDLITDPEMFSRLKELITRSAYDLVIFNAVDDIAAKHLLCNIPFKSGQEFEGEELAAVYDEFLKTKNLHHIWMMVFDRNLFDWEYEYNEPFRMLRDGPSLILPVISKATKVLYLDDVFYYWRIQNLSSASKHYDVTNFFYSIRTLHKRVIEYSDKWPYKTAKTDELVKSNYVTDICIAAMKVRSLSPDSGISQRELLAKMANDDMFRNEYSLKNLEGFRKPIAFCLYHKWYLLLKLLSSMIGIIKRR